MQLSDPKNKLIRYLVDHPEQLEHKAKHGFFWPATAEVDLTLRCSLNCKGCHSKWLHKPQELDEAQIDRILTQLSGIGVRSLAWSGGGEPLESPHWRHAIDTGYAMGFKQGLYSWLPQIDQEKVEWLSQRLSFAYTHNTTAKVFKPANTDCVWTCGWLLDDKNWHLIKELSAKVNWGLFDFVDFRPLIVDGMDYSWVPDAIEIFRSMEESPVFKWAEYKFRDLTLPSKGRHYDKCLSTDFVVVVGSDGTVWECINRRGITSIGNILTEDLKDIWMRKQHERCDLNGCRMLCRNHEDNKALWHVLGPAPKHKEFV